MREVEIARRGAEGAMAEPPLDGVDVHAGFQQIRGEGVAQAVNPPELGDAGPSFRRRIRALNARRIQGPLGPAGREEPRARERPRTWLFAARGAERPLDPSGIQRAYTAAKRRAGITKLGGIHGLRHAFATYLLEAGVDVHTIQRWLGHRALSTTSRYFHLAHPTLLAHRSPLDLLDGPSTPAPTAQA